MDIAHFSLHFHWPGGAGRSTENGDRLSDSAITPMAMGQVIHRHRYASTHSFVFSLVSELDVLTY